MKKFATYVIAILTLVMAFFAAKFAAHMVIAGLIGSVVGTAVLVLGALAVLGVGFVAVKRAFR